MTQDISSSHAQGAHDVGAYQGLAPGWYGDADDSSLARYWDGTRLLDERRPVLHAHPTDDVSSAVDLLIENGKLSNGSTDNGATRPVVSEDGLLSIDGVRVRAKNLLGHGLGPGPRWGAGTGALTRLLVALGAVLVIIAVIDEIGGDSNHLALGTAAVGICFIVAVAAEATLSATKLGARSARTRRPQPKRVATAPRTRRPAPARTRRPAPARTRRPAPAASATRRRR